MSMVDPVSCPQHVAVQLAGRSWIARRQVGGPLTVHVLLTYPSPEDVGAARSENIV